MGVGSTTGKTNTWLKNHFSISFNNRVFRYFGLSPRSLMQSRLNRYFKKKIKLLPSQIGFINSHYAQDWEMILEEIEKSRRSILNV